MPLLGVLHRSSSHRVAIPECPRCHKPGSVGEVTLPDPSISPGVQYWRCEGCRYLWVTVDGRAQ
jgi:hypothetical protein